MILNLSLFRRQAVTALFKSAWSNYGLDMCKTEQANSNKTA